MTVSVVLPVHNEAEMLKITLPSIQQLHLDEVVIVFDRCTDNSEKIVDETLNGKIIKLHVNHVSNWSYHLNFLYNLLVEHANSDIILFTQADVYLDSKIRKILKTFHGTPQVFRVLPIPNTFWRLIQYTDSMVLTSLTKGFHGVFAVSKLRYLADPLTEDEKLNFDSAMLQKWRKQYEYYKTFCFNLRPFTPRSRLYSLGRTKAKAGKPFFKVLAFSMVRLMPEVLIGYIHARKQP